MMMDRYIRQSTLPEVGSTGQDNIASASVLIVGVGGLGLPAAVYLAGAGVGRIGLVDADTVSESNLHRQVFFTERDIGQNKVAVTARHIKNLNSDINVIPIPKRVASSNIDYLIAGYDIVVDAADNFAVTYLLSDTCQLHNLPLVSASVLGTKGYVGVFCADSPSYGALFPNAPEGALTCSQSGVFGPIVGVIGLIQAQEVLKLVLNPCAALRGKLLCVDMWGNYYSTLDFSKSCESTHHQRIPILLIEDICNGDLVVDVRDHEEIMAAPLSTSLQIPVDEILSNIDKIKGYDRIVFCCVSGRRAAKAAKYLIDEGSNNVAIIALG